MQPAVKDTNQIYQVERREYYATRPGFRIAEMQISPTQTVPWHYHNEVQDTFYVVTGKICIFTREPEEEVRLTAGKRIPSGRAARIRSPMPVTHPRCFSSSRVWASTILCR
jgi:quercetin dioxygenase-like cupin family protein